MTYMAMIPTSSFHAAANRRLLVAATQRWKVEAEVL